jgi:methyl-accepting chemotaxis protein
MEEQRNLTQNMVASFTELEKLIVNLGDLVSDQHVRQADKTSQAASVPVSKAVPTEAIPA